MKFTLEVELGFGTAAAAASTSLRPLTDWLDSSRLWVQSVTSSSRKGGVTERKVHSRFFFSSSSSPSSTLRLLRYLQWRLHWKYWENKGARGFTFRCACFSPPSSPEHRQPLSNSVSQPASQPGLAWCFPLPASLSGHHGCPWVRGDPEAATRAGSIHGSLFFFYYYYFYYFFSSFLCIDSVREGKTTTTTNATFSLWAADTAAALTPTPRIRTPSKEHHRPGGGGGRPGWGVTGKAVTRRTSELDRTRTRTGGSDWWLIALPPGD